MKVVLNDNYDAFLLSVKACKFLGIPIYNHGSEYFADHKRSDPKLIECVEKLREEVNYFSNLIIVDIPDEIKDWHIENDYGKEFIVLDAKRTQRKDEENEQN